MNRTSYSILLAGALAAFSGTITGTARAQQPPQTGRPADSLLIDNLARLVVHDRSVFGPDPDYSKTKYDFQAQLDIYGAKHMNRTQRPLLELGRELYQNGPFDRGRTLLGAHNILSPQLLVYGDARSAAGYNAGAANVGRWGNRLNLDVDLKLTATERIHALFRPIEKKGKFTGYERVGDSSAFTGNFDGEPAALFFEGDAGALLGGLIGRDAPFDMPIAAGLMPLLFHNGVWIEDAFTGFAFTIPARNSASLGWSNFDISFFFGGDRVSNVGVGTGKDAGRIFGAISFIEAMNGYAEAGYAYVAGANDGGRDFHSMALSFTRRYAGRVSNSLRYIGAVGSNALTGGKANGHLLLIENSLITSQPSTVVPYLNLFVGLDSPVSAARDPGAGGILKNTGLSFEADAITAFPSLDATAKDAAGGALGLELLGSGLDRQLVVEVAGTYPLVKTPVFPGEQYGVGVRIQQPLSNAIIFRLDGMYGKRSGLANVSGVRLELRHKF